MSGAVKKSLDRQAGFENCLDADTWTNENKKCLFHFTGLVAFKKKFFSANILNIFGIE